MTTQAGPVDTVDSPAHFATETPAGDAGTSPLAPPLGAPAPEDDDFGAADVDAASQLYGALRVVREKHRPSGKSLDGGQWEARLERDVVATLGRARAAAAHAGGDGVARRAVQLMLRTDLVNACSARLAQVLRHARMREAADLVTTLWHSYASVSKDWEGLMQDQEETFEQLSDERLRSAEQEARDLRARLAEARTRNGEVSRGLAQRDAEVALLRRQVREMNDRLFEATGSRVARIELQARGGLNAWADRLKRGKSGSPGPGGDGAGGKDGAAADSSALRESTPAGGGGGGVSSTAGPRAVKALTRRQVLDQVRELWASKAESDANYRAGRQERETMEEHLYRSLNTKYGLRPLVLEAAEALLRGLARWKNGCVELTHFAKCLASQVEEEAREQLVGLRGAVEAAARRACESAMPGASSAQREAAVRSRLQGSLPAEEAFAVARAMKSTEEAEEVSQRLHRGLDARRREATSPARPQRVLGGAGSALGASVASMSVRGSMDASGISIDPRASHGGAAVFGPSSRPPPGHVPFEELVEHILAARLAAHERAIAPLVRSFRACDEDRRGFVDEEGFVALCRAVDPGVADASVDALLESLDPSRTGRVTFSSCIAALAPEA